MPREKMIHVIEQYYADGRIVDGEHDMTWKDVQAFVGGYVEYVKTTNDFHVLLVNEDGLAFGLSENPNATACVRRDVWMDRGGIRGNAVLARARPC